MDTYQLMPGTDRIAHRSRSEELPAIQRFRYLPPASLSACDVRCEAGLDRILYIQALVTEDSDK